MSGSFDRVMEERKQLVDQIIENMKQGYILPKPQWGVSPFTFHNPVSNAKYHGANMIKLYLCSAKFGYTDTRFMTYKQAQSKGWQIRKGEKGIRLEKFIFTKQVEQKNPDTGQMEKITVRLQRPMVNTFVVFNASQIDGIEPMEEMQPLEHNEVLELADQLISSSECPVKEEMQDQAYYSPKRDVIVLPSRNAFISQEAFATTLMHEMVHSTGHQSRLDRSMLNKFGTPEYALEELRAELGAFFMGTDLGIEGSQELLDSHTNYLKSWISVLEDDPNELFRACSDAQKAVERLSNNLEQYRELRQEYVVIETANKRLEDLAKNIHQHISDFGKSEVSYSVDTILKDLETGNIKIYKDILEEYAEDLYVDGAESTAYASVGAIGRDEADKSVDKYNEVMHTCTRLQEFSEKSFSVHKSQLESAIENAIDEAMAAAEIPEPDFEMEL